MSATFAKKANNSKECANCGVAADDMDLVHSEVLGMTLWYYLCKECQHDDKMVRLAQT